MKLKVLGALAHHNRRLFGSEDAETSRFTISALAMGGDRGYYTVERCLRESDALVQKNVKLFEYGAQTTFYVVPGDTELGDLKKRMPWRRALEPLDNVSLSELLEQVQFEIGQCNPECSSKAVGLKELIMCGLRATCTIASRKEVANRDPRVVAFIQEALQILTEPASRCDLQQLTSLAVTVGQNHQLVLKLLGQDTASPFPSSIAPSV